VASMVEDIHLVALVASGSCSEEWVVWDRMNAGELLTEDNFVVEGLGAEDNCLAAAVE
jgi:hypothetical protein